MKKFLALFSILSILSCESKEEKRQKFLKDFQEQAKEMKKNQIALFLDAKPKYFSAKTINGATFSSENYKGKNLVIFIYDKSYLKKSETYDMSEEYNALYKEFKNNVNFIGIIEGFIENEKELKDYLNQSNILFEQIDNTKSYDKSEKLNYNIFCSPAKILIDINGKVIHSSCGGGNSTEITRKLDSIKVASK